MGAVSSEHERDWPGQRAEERGGGAAIYRKWPSRPGAEAEVRVVPAGLGAISITRTCWLLLLALGALTYHPTYPACPTANFCLGLSSHPEHRSAASEKTSSKSSIFWRPTPGVRPSGTGLTGPPGGRFSPDPLQGQVTGAGSRLHAAHGFALL